MMKKNGILSILTLCILGFAILACDGASTPDVPKPASAEEAFDEVVKVLHASYADGEYFFKVFPQEKKAAEVTQGSAVTAGEANTFGNGTYTVTVGETAVSKYSIFGGDSDCTAGNPIIYEYKDYQPRGSWIIVNGSLTGSRTTSPLSCGAKAFQFCKGVDTLTMSGHFDATLKLTYRGGSRMIATNQSIEPLLRIMGDDSVEFTYEYETMKLTKEQRTQLFKVVKTV